MVNRALNGRQMPPIQGLIRGLKNAKKTTPEPSSPLHPIPTSPNARTAALQAIEFQPLQGLHFERSIAPLPNTAFEIFQLFCPLELVD